MAKSFEQEVIHDLKLALTYCHSYPNLTVHQLNDDGALGKFLHYFTPKLDQEGIIGALETEITDIVACRSWRKLLKKLIVALLQLLQGDPMSVLYL